MLKGMIHCIVFVLSLFVYPPDIIAEHLSVRLIIVQAQRALVGSKSEVVLVCMYVSMYVCP